MNKRKIKIIATILVTGFMLGCRSRYIPDLSEQIVYDCKVIIYSDKIHNKNIEGFEYYNEKGQLIEKIGHEHRMKYIYNEKRQLAEAFNCRIYNCQIGWRTILIYDSNENYIGTYRTREQKLNTDTVEIEQVKFYDENNHLIRELTDRGHNVFNGKPYEYWKDYIIENEKIIEEITTYNNDTIWIGKYFYNETGNLISIYRQNGQKYQKETFEYDSLGNVIAQKIEDNTYPLTKDVSFSATNWSATFLYNEQRKLIEEIRYNHKGEEYLKYIYVYEYKK